MAGGGEVDGVPLTKAVDHKASNVKAVSAPIAVMLHRQGVVGVFVIEVANYVCRGAISLGNYYIVSLLLVLVLVAFAISCSTSKQ